MKCPYCGYENNKNAKFCKNCGKNIENVAQNASYTTYDDSDRTHHAKKKLDKMKIALGSACAVLVVAIGLLAFALVTRHNNNLRAEEEKASITVTESETTADTTEADTEQTAETATQAQTADTSAATTASTEAVAQTTTETESQTTEYDATYFTPAGEEELPSTEATQEEKSETEPKNAGGDYVYRDASFYPEDFYFPDSDSKYLDEDDLKGFTEYECDITRNEIYARHGYAFQTEKFEDYFKQFSWYEEDPNYSESRLNKYEKKNASMILEYEKDKGWK